MVTLPEFLTVLVITLLVGLQGISAHHTGPHRLGSRHREMVKERQKNNSTLAEKRQTCTLGAWQCSGNTLQSEYTSIPGNC
jgi:hypothetical protein